MDKEMDRIEKYKAIAKYAKQLGFDDIGFDNVQFWAKDTKTSLLVWRTQASPFDKRIHLEISWASSGSKTTPAKVQRFIRMLQNALKLRERLAGVK